MQLRLLRTVACVEFHQSGRFGRQTLLLWLLFKGDGTDGAESGEDFLQMLPRHIGRQGSYMHGGDRAAASLAASGLASRRSRAGRRHGQLQPRIEELFLRTR